MVKFFKYVALLEGVSLLALLFIAMPMKYIFDNPFLVKHVGMAHGILFVIYIILALLFYFEKKWDLKTLGIASIASIIPFGTFYVEKKYL